MLLSFQIEGFKSYADATLTLARNRDRQGRPSPLSVLIGANASGKTNLIEGFRLVSAIAAGTRLDTFRSGSGTAGMRGSLRDLGYRGASLFSFECSTDFGEYPRYRITLELREDRLHIRDERVWNPSRKVPLFEVFGASGAEEEYDALAANGANYNAFELLGRAPRPGERTAHVSSATGDRWLAWMSSSLRLACAWLRRRPTRHGHPLLADAGCGLRDASSVMDSG